MSDEFIAVTRTDASSEGESQGVKVAKEDVVLAKARVTVRNH